VDAEDGHEPQQNQAAPLQDAGPVLSPDPGSGPEHSDTWTVVSLCTDPVLTRMVQTTRSP
jgi:hypothetical protein